MYLYGTKCSNYGLPYLVRSRLSQRGLAAVGYKTLCGRYAQRGM